jgi:hypothetical protein
MDVGAFRILRRLPLPYHPKPTTAPFDLSPGACRWVFATGGRPVPIVAVTRRTVTVTYGSRRIELKRRRLERTGHDIGGGTTFRVTTYELPHETASSIASERSFP